jgi:hypothetical protein
MEMRPMVFCASLAPCPKLNAADDMSCNFLKALSVFFLLEFLKTRIIRHMKKKPKTAPITGVNIMKAKMTSIPFETKAPEPKANQTGPMSPPIKACDDDIGNPNFVHIHIHEAAPVKAQNTTYGSM